MQPGFMVQRWDSKSDKTAPAVAELHPMAAAESITQGSGEKPGNAGRWGVWGEPHVSTPPGAEAQTAHPVGTCRMWADTRDRLREA